MIKGVKFLNSRENVSQKKKKKTKQTKTMNKIRNCVVRQHHKKHRETIQNKSIMTRCSKIQNLVRFWNSKNTEIFILNFVTPCN